MHLSCICIYFFQKCLIYSCAHKFTHPLQNVHNVNNLNKIRGFIKCTCCFIFSTVLIKLFHITDVYIYSTRQNYTWIYKKLSHLIVYIPLYLNTICHFLDDPRLVLYFVIVVHESLVGPEQFLDKSSSSCTFFGLPASSVYLNPSKNDCMILRSIFSHWGQLRDSFTTITKGGNIYSYSRRQHNSLRAGGWTLFNRIYVNSSHFV